MMNEGNCKRDDECRKLFKASLWRSYCLLSNYYCRSNICIVVKSRFDSSVGSRMEQPEGYIVCRHSTAIPTKTEAPRVNIASKVKNVQFCHPISLNIFSNLEKHGLSDALIEEINIQEMIFPKVKDAESLSLLTNLKLSNLPKLMHLVHDDSRLVSSFFGRFRNG